MFSMETYRHTARSSCIKKELSAESIVIGVPKSSDAKKGGKESLIIQKVLL